MTTTKGRACDGKMKRTEKDARRHVRYLRTLAAGRSSVQAYKCSFCDGWHVGHRPRRRRANP